MIDIKDLNNKELPTTDLDLFPGLDCFADSEDYIKNLSNLEQEKVYGGLWVYVGCYAYFVK